MNKKSFLFLSLIFVVSLSGCSTINTVINGDVYLSSNQEKENYVLNDEDFRITINVINNNAISFDGVLEFDYDKNCLEIRNGQDEVNIKAPPSFENNGKFSVIVEFSPKRISSDQYKENCIQRPQKIYANLYDEDSKALKDYLSTNLVIVE